MKIEDVITESIIAIDTSDEFRRGFDQVKDTVRGRLDGFDVYLEHVRFFILDICLEIPESSLAGERPSGMDKSLFTVPDDFDEESDLINEMFES